MIKALLEFWLDLVSSLEQSEVSGSGGHVTENAPRNGKFNHHVRSLRESNLQ